MIYKNKICFKMGFKFQVEFDLVCSDFNQFMPVIAATLRCLAILVIFQKISDGEMLNTIQPLTLLHIFCEYMMNSNI